MQHTYHKITIALLLAGCIAGLVACSPPQQPAEAATGPTSLSVIPADILKITPSELARGPMISGTLQPVVKAELNAEVSAIVTKVLKDNADPVSAGELLLQLDQTTFRDKLVSAQEAERSAALASDQAQRQLRRMQQLRKQELVTAEVLETAEIRANQTQSDLASAKARTVEARQQLERTLVRAPFDGVVAVRRVSAGDTAQVGKALMTLINPASMRFEGYIAADWVGQVQVGQQVKFQVNGYNEQYFSGEVERINPLANEATRQVQVLVKLAQQHQGMVAGLYAEGHIETSQQQSLMVPQTALVVEGDHAFLWQVKDQQLHKVPVKLGSKDRQWGTQQLLSGVEAGATVLRYPQGALKDGATVELSDAPAKAATAQVGG